MSGAMTIRLCSLVLLSALLSVGALAQTERGEQHQESTPERNLADFLAVAEAHYPALRADDHAITAAEARLGEARFSPFFRWTATAAVTLAPDSRGTPIFSDQGQLPLDSWGPALGANIQGAIPLYTFGKLRSLRHAAEAGIRAAEADRERSLARVQYDVRRAYYGLQLALDVEQMINEGRGQLAGAIRKLDQMLEEGDNSVNPIDRRRLAAALAEVDARASETTRLRESSEAALRTLTGLDTVRVPECPMAAAPVTDETTADILDRAEGARPEIRMLEAAVAAREEALSAQRASYAPDLLLAFRAGITWTPGRTNQDNPWIADPSNQPSLGAGILLRWNLDLAGNVFRTRRAEAQLEETRADVATARAGLNLELELAISQLEDARRREAAWAIGERETRAWFIAAAQGYDVGTLEPRDLIDALKAYFQARFAHLQALMELNVAAANLERSSGAPLFDRNDWEPPCD